MKKKKPSLAEIVSRNIRKARLEAGMTQKELADKAGFKVSYVARLETKPQNLSLVVLERLAAPLSVSPQIFLGDSEGTKDRTNNSELLKELSRIIKKLPTKRHFK